jgi:hypothetical protein
MNESPALPCLNKCSAVLAKLQATLPKFLNYIQVRWASNLGRMTAVSGQFFYY